MISDTNKQKLYNLIQSYAVAFKSEDQILMQLAGKELTTLVEKLAAPEEVPAPVPAQPNVVEPNQGGPNA